MKRRVVLTGIGPVTPCGTGADALWQSAAESRSGITLRAESDLPTIPIRAAGFVRDFEPAKFIANRKSLKVMCRDIQMAVVASYLARENAGLTAENIVPVRSGVCIGAGVFEHDPEEMSDSFKESLTEDAHFDVVKFGASGMGRLFPLWLLKYLPNMPACHITIAHNLQGPSNTITADSSGSMSSIEEALRVIDRGTADLMFCGGAECRLYGAGLLRYQARGELKNGTGTAAEYPVFSDRSAGIVPGEGGTILVLESLEHAKARLARPLAELLGFFSGGDLSDGNEKELAAGMAHAMREAIRSSGLRPEDVDVIHVSAKGLALEDRAEAEAIRAVFGSLPAERRPRLAVTKGLSGFLGYAAAPTEVALAARSLAAGRSVPSVAAAGSPLLADFRLTSAADGSPVKHILVNHFEAGLAHHALVLGGPGGIDA